MKTSDGMLLEDRDCPRTCYECNHPMQLSGLYGGRCFARFSRDEYFACQYANPAHAHDCVSRLTDMDAGLRMRDLMRERFDLIMDDLERSTGIHLDVEHAAELLTHWDEGGNWLHCAATRRNLPWMLLFTGPRESATRVLVRKDSELHRKLAAIKFIRLEDEPPCHVRVTWVRRMWRPLWFGLQRRRTIIRDGGSYDTYRLRLWANGLPLGDDLTILADDHYLDDPPAQRDRRLLGIAERVLENRTKRQR